jgi:TadE-like protein
MRGTLVSQRTRGQALVEFALVAPIFILLFMGIIEFGRFVLAYEALNNATREGARYAIVHGSSSNCPSGPMPGGGTSPSACADASGMAVQNQVLRYGFTLKLSTSSAGVIPPCPTPGTNQVAVCWQNLDNARGHSVTVTANYTFSTIVPLPIPPISMTGRSTLVINH